MHKKSLKMSSNSIRTLVLTNHLPYPPMGGSALRNWQNINILMKLGPVAIFSISNHYEELKYYSQYPPGVTLWSNNYLNKLSTQSSFFQKKLWWLQPRKHYVFDSLYRDYIYQELEKTLLKFQPTLVVFAELCLYRYLDVINCEKCFTILDEHNIEASLFAESQSSVKGLKSKLRASAEINKFKYIERDFIRQVNQVWTCSVADACLLHNMYGWFPKVRVIPNGIDVAHYECVRLGQCTLPDGLRQIPWTLLFTATFGYQPNQVAAQLLIEQIFPRLVALYPDCCLILAGKLPTPGMQEAAKQNPKIIVTGLVEDIRPYLAISTVVITPLLQGGGSRLKILEAFASGRPVVSTTKGAEGLKAQDGQHLLIRNSVDELVAGVCELWTDCSLKQTLTKNAYELVKAEYSWESVGKEVKQSLQKIFYDVK
ncbi:MAG: glycosyltransferase family 4 protein [Scytonema sp. PMC 1069.18]|nr:glycosyltransferase family 4 protein [Scytonema sp. PMC 1069.18]MEC4882332.1 glycosyltransferase family 4 protein [Scytonema sp. PMC 1070.18]